MAGAFLDACRGRTPEHTPVWFMRQAGRYLPSYRRIRERATVLQVAKDPELSSEVAADAVRQLGVDAAVLFADIMLPLEGIGVELEIREDVGPVIAKPVRAESDVVGLSDFDAGSQVPFVMEGIRRLKEKLDGSVPVIGFSGAPFTLASYMVEGSPTREFSETKKLMYGRPDVWNALMKKLTEVVSEYLKAQVGAGVDAVQLFDSWAGCLSPSDYERYVKPYTSSVFRSLPGSTPKIHFCADSSALLEHFAETGCDILSVDWRVQIDSVWRRAGEDAGAQGNLDPVAAVVGGEEMEIRVREILNRVGERRKYIFNLGHGVLKETPPENLRRIVKLVHELTGKRR
jgi:uroporphyrinogen decarboxylase